ncbi:hypothetical protein VCR1J2_20295 [Vibrio coralliirubri]|nr:hypothetical protein VCR1J2_20295 [Vibrio coralliirubri]CDT84939.1 hypothetical protein VCR8J2_240298 [Vibrio coralliirubri]
MAWLYIVYAFKTLERIILDLSAEFFCLIAVNPMEEKWESMFKIN